MAANNHRTIPPLSESDRRRFWAKVDKTPGQGPKGDCHIWTAYKTDKGYGKFGIGHEIYRATRVALFLKTGADPGEANTLHSCDWPPCVNGDHLSAGTDADNTRDMMTKGRHRPAPQIGEAHWKARLTAEDVREIRRLHALGESSAVIAAKFNYAASNIGGIVNRRVWKSV